LARTPIRTAIVRIFHAAVRLYFRRIERVGEVPGPGTGGRLFVSNHQNALVDPILVLTDAPCAISPIAKSTLWSIPGLRYLLDVAEAVPLVRRKDSPDKDAKANDATFERIATHLAGGGNVLIFPEGKSHSESKVAPLRTGAARMLLLAAKRAAERGGPAQPLTFQAVGLEFNARDRFRSRCLVLWGPVRALEDVPGEDEARVQAVTARMGEDLRELLVEGESHEERLLIARVAELLANDAGHDTLQGWNDIGRQVELASKTLGGLGGLGAGSATTREVSEAVGSYFTELHRHGLEDRQLSASGAPVIELRSTHRLGRALLAPLAAAGMVLFAPPYFVTRLVAGMATEGDMVSTIKLGTGLVAHPLWACALIVAAWLLLPPFAAAGATALVLAAPFAALRWLDAMEAPRAGAADATPEQLAALRAARAAALATIERARAQLSAAS
jgi:glycerol-3-phosphate O-acyltransferase/dihydroxyacetone phosphate acyltransferase